MPSRAQNIYDQLAYVFHGTSLWFWDTSELLADIMLEFLVRSLDLAIVIFNLLFQVVCFLRDLCIEAMQTFANVFRGIVNVVSSINTEDVEDFASACLVVILWIGVGRFLFGTINKNYGPYNPLRLLNVFSWRKEKLDSVSSVQNGLWVKTISRKKTHGIRKKRNTTKF
ncbi:uncharacterized protein [Chelonus insularis]|uniref:uncharacterized protein n=1 Tax=Chelonus insularis TaxID=460826 RepID=UPI00158D971A|nr:uncharacterized protein LOC118072437 [Chelonus insularis]